MKTPRTSNGPDQFTGKNGGLKKAEAMAAIATFKNSKVAIVTHAALAEHFPGLLPSHSERMACAATDPDHYSVYSLDGGLCGALLFTAAPEPIWERNVKCTLSDGRVFYWHNTMQTIGGETFPFSDIAPNWMGEPDATYELIEQDAAWETASFERIAGFRPGSMLVVEDCKYNGQRVLMASEGKFGVAEIFERNGWLGNDYWHIEPWAMLRGWHYKSHEWCYFDAHKGMRTRIASGKTSTIWIYITA